MTTRNINGLNLKLVNHDFSENIAEKDAEEKYFYEVKDEYGEVFYHKSKTDNKVVYAFNCEPSNGWCIVVEKLEIVD